MASKDVTISLEFTPNPNTLKFVVSQPFMERGAANFPNLQSADKSPLAQALYKVEGVTGVLIGTNFVTITKGAAGDWDVIADQVPKTLETHFKNGTALFVEGFDPNAHKPSVGGSSAVETKIREVLDNEIRPAVAMDGGDITFEKFEDGTVYLHLQGACSSCPSSIATLKIGVETRLKEVIPEIKEVVQV